MTSLHWAVQNEHAQVCRYLLSSGANPSILNNQGQTIYQLKTSDTIQLTLKNEPPVSQFEIEQQLLEAARNSDLEILKVKRRETERERKRKRERKIKRKEDKGMKD